MSELKRLYAGDLVTLQTLFRGKNVDDADFSGEDLDGLDFTGASLRRARFDAARIRNARFDFAYVRRAALRRAVDWREHVAAWQPEPGSKPEPHRTRERFSEAPFAPELVLLPGIDLLGWEDQLAVHEIDAADAGTLALGAVPVTRAEYLASRGHWPGRPFEASDADSPDWIQPQVFEETTAQDYVAWLSATLGGRYVVPSPGLLRLAALGTWGWEGIALDGLLVGMAPGSRMHGFPDALVDASARTNPFGLVDVVGGYAEIAVDADTGAAFAVGGRYDEDVESRVRATFATPRPLSDANHFDCALRVARLFS